MGHYGKFGYALLANAAACGLKLYLQYKSEMISVLRAIA